MALPESRPPEPPEPLDRPGARARSPRWTRPIVDAVIRQPGWTGSVLSILAAALVLVPPVVYQSQHFFFGWHDVGNYTRANYNFFDFGRFAEFSDGTADFFAGQHFELFFFLLCLPVRLFGTSGFVGACTAAVVLAAGYVFAFTRLITRSFPAATLCAAAYVLNPYTAAIALNYHPEAFAILFLLAFAYHASARQTWRAWLALCLALTVKEDMWVYGIVVAALVASRHRFAHTAGFIGGALAYYVIAVLGIGGSWYPGANYFNSFYELNGHPLTKAQIALQLLGRWREFLPLLFTGPGLLFQLSFLFVGILSGWRYVLACGVMLLWLTYPGGPPRTNFEYYYSYAALLVGFVILPFALVTLRSLAARMGGEPWRERAVVAAMGLVLTTCTVMHLPGYVPEPIRESVDLRRVFDENPRHVNQPVVRQMIAQYLQDHGSVLSQFYIVASLPQHRKVYLTASHARAFLDGRIRPVYVLLDLGATDPYTSRETTQAMVARLRRGDDYRALYDARDVLLYKRSRSD